MNTALEKSNRPASSRRRALMQMAGSAVALGVLATTACAPAERGTATSSPSPTQPATSLATGDTSNGADNFYTSDQVTVQKVTFKNQYQMGVTGNLFVPNDMDRNAKNPAMVVGHPMGAVKEQSANLYATKLAERGFVTLSLDLSYWGESEGQPRNLVAPDVYTEDFSAAVDYLRTQSFVDSERIGALGVCGSGSFVISAAKIDPRIKAVATVSMYDMGGVNRNGLRGAMTPEMRQQALALAAQQRDVEFAGGKTEYIGGTPFELTDQSTPIDREFYDFYRTARGNSPATSTQPTLSSNVRFMNFYPFEDIETISPRPMLFITGDQAHSREFSDQAYQLAVEPKQLVTIPGAGHVDLYDRVDLIPFDTLATFFQNSLNPQG
ncbi:alpha/beta hydrolase [Mycobacterium sp. ITM-2016-00316]|uniref:alpha/beta hydrolase n=1 Tax=Mycobacterium sp. ITM-2016-00316 TaxID=2099695 RepID=UPI001E535EC7|nr:alpha/beta hydrolase [Mycobacterium sp. ITM-2016-00316]WNG82419.1 alpha/beta hydrolase [Mycobacterium sp. ITM-2016-00316]